MEILFLVLEKFFFKKKFVEVVVVRSRFCTVCLVEGCWKIDYLFLNIYLIRLVTFIIFFFVFLVIFFINVLVDCLVFLILIFIL